MPDKNNDLPADPSKCLSQLFSDLHRGTAHFATPEAVVEEVKERRRDLTLDPNDPLVRGLIAAVALRLDPNDGWDNVVRVAFEKAGLDHKNPIHWRILMRQFAGAHYRIKRGRGAPSLWDAKRYCRLLQDEARVWSQHPTFSNEDVCRTIARRSGYTNARGQRQGKPLSKDRIKSALREARESRCNADLAAYLLRMMRSGRAYYLKEGWAWSPATEAEFTQASIGKYCAEVSKTGKPIGPS
jgi:hypothetical protein